MFLILKSTTQNTHYVSCYGCVVAHNYNKPEAVHSFYFMKNNFFPRKLCFFTVSIFEFNAFSNKIPETAFAFVEWFTVEYRKMSTFTRLLTLFLFDEKFVSLSKFLRNYVYSTFSCFSLTFLIIKSQKQSVLICQMVSD